jgi:hypothetical protein
MTKPFTLDQCPLWILEPQLFEAILRIVSQHDLEGIITPANPRGWTEYASEVESMLPRLKRASSAADVERIVRQVFRQCFGRAPRQSAVMAAALWQCLRRPQHRRALACLVDLETPIMKLVKKLRQSPRRKADRMRLALVAALEKQASLLKTEKDLRRIFGEDSN